LLNRLKKPGCDGDPSGCVGRAGRAGWASPPPLLVTNTFAAFVRVVAAL